LDSWDCLYDNASDFTDKRVVVRKGIFDKVLKDSVSIKDKMPHNIKENEIDNFVQDLRTFHTAISVIDDPLENGTIQDKLVSALEYVKIYPKIEALKKRQIEAKYPEN
jgi:hypothetical protein